LAGPFASLQDLLRPPFWEWTAAAFGLIVGSFANVCIHRIPRDEPIGSPPSRCPGCGSPIRPWDNIPVVSFILLRGRCRTCGTRISARYPLVEAGNALAYWGAAVAYGPSLAAAIAMALVTALLVLSLIDLDHQILPDVITRPAIVVGIAASFAIHRAGLDNGAREAGLIGGTFWWEAPAAAAAGYAAFALIAWAGRKYYGQEALGRGDWKLAAMLGAFLGFKGLLLTVFIGSLLGAVIGGSMVLLRKTNWRSKIPFGTFLGFAGLVVVLVGRPIWMWYAGFYGH
jgi:leader peptidase (prepilin peptidase) / N-methyltransferase